MSKFLVSLAKKEIFVPHFERHMLKNDVVIDEVNSFKAKDDYFHPSGDCTPCERALFYKFSGDRKPEILDVTSKKNFMVGHFWHAWMQKIAVEAGITEQKYIEQTLTQQDASGWTVIGSLDIAKAYAPGRDEPYLIDFKTMNSRVFSGEPAASVMEKWRCQVNVYMDIQMHYDDVHTGQPSPKQAIIIGIQKDTPHAFREFVIDYDADLVARIYDKWSTVWAALQIDTPPQCECPIGKCPVEGMYV